MISHLRREQPASVVEYAPKRTVHHEGAPADDVANGILALLHKAAETAKEDCARAMDIAHKLSTQLRSAEERAREFEAQANHFRERAATAENWLVVIHNGVQQTFFQNQNKTSSNGHA
jgi:hypothetical protein